MIIWCGSNGQADIQPQLTQKVQIHLEPDSSGIKNLPIRVQDQGTNVFHHYAQLNHIASSRHRAVFDGGGLFGSFGQAKER